MKALFAALLVCIAVEARAQAVPAGGAGWAGCTATFVKSASGIVNETNRICPGEVETYGGALRVQFRPIGGKPNVACDPKGLLPISFSGWSTNDPNLTPWFGSTTYNVCFYYDNPQIGGGTINSASQAGQSFSVFVGGQYQICVDGTYANGSINVADAKYVSVSNFASVEDGLGVYLPQWAYLGAGFGEVMLENMRLPCGDYNVEHHYCVAKALAPATYTLAVCDGVESGGVCVPNGGWYGDNHDGTFTFSVTYLGQ